jgi:hypothetical protein
MKLCCLCLMIILIAGCASSSKNVTTEKLSDASFAGYKKYAYLPTTDTAFTKMVSRKKFVNELVPEVVKQLNKRKMVLDTAHPDCLFQYTFKMGRKYDASRNEEVVYNAQIYSNPYDFENKIYYFSSDNRPVVYGGKVNIDTLRTGSLVIDMIDVKENKVVWRATAAGELEEAQVPTLQEMLHKIIPKMFKEFPTK